MTDSNPRGVTMAELQLSTRNHGILLEALRYAITPVGLHYLLTHFDIPLVDPSTWRMRVDGSVAQTASFSLDDLRAMPATTRVLTMECAGNGRAFLDPRPASQPWLLEAVGTGQWTGVELHHVLALVGSSESSVEVVLTGADRGVDGGIEQAYQRSLTLEEVASTGVLLAYDLNGAPLPPQHGFPLRAVIPGWYGMSNVKWLASITAVEERFTGYQQAVSYRLRQHEHDVGEPITRILPRSLMMPPGIPEFSSRSRVVAAGECLIAGRAWSGFASITSVEVSTDGGLTWAQAELDGPPVDKASWIGWRFIWQATTGDHELCCRATDGSGNTQPDRPQWNRGGYTNNAIQRVAVLVTGS
ncbi:MAG TPA: sulfite oxidase [Ilumatobacteraceae bacterium]|nr:sulfite oxidase [Ilumatobacteraceae bacterium]